MDDFGRLVVLMIEPHQLVRRIMRDILRVIGVGETHAVETIEDAYGWLKTTHADVVMVDWSSATDALGLLRLLRAEDSPNPYVPVIVVSAYGDRDHVREARDAGADEYMLKPFAPQTVVARMRAIVEHPRLFVKAEQFAGPDRRRHRSLDFPGPERRRETHFVDRRVHAQSFIGPDRRRRRPLQAVKRAPSPAPQQPPVQH